MGQVQEQIKLLHEFRGDTSQYVERAKYILSLLLSRGEVYTIQSPKNSRNDLFHRCGKVFCGINESNDPCIWIFSELEYAYAYAEHFDFKIDDFYMVRSLSVFDLERIIYTAMFKGVKTIRIDEGFTYLNVSIYDFLNAVLEARGKSPIIKKSDKPIITFFNEMRYKDRLAYVIKDNARLEQQSLFDIPYNFIKEEFGLDLSKEEINESSASTNSLDTEVLITRQEKDSDIDLAKQVVLMGDEVKIYANKSDANKDLDSSSLELILLNYEKITNLASELIENPLAQNFKFISGDKEICMNIKKASMILDKMK